MHHEVKTSPLNDKQVNYKLTETEICREHVQHAPMQQRFLQRSLQFHPKPRTKAIACDMYIFVMYEGIYKFVLKHGIIFFVFRVVA